MEKKVLGELKVQLDYGNEDVISNILSRRGYDTLVKFISEKEDKAREEGYKKGYIDGQFKKIDEPKPVVSEFDKTSYLN